MKKVYIQPSVENTLLMASSIICVSNNGTLPVSPNPIPGAGGD